MTYVTSNVGAEEIRKSGMRSQDSLLTRVMVGYSYFAFLMLAGFFSPLFGNEDGSAPLQAVFQPIMFLIYGGSIFFMLFVTRLRRALVQYLIGNASLVVPMLLIAASVFWSDDPATTIRRTGALVGSTATAIFCGLLHGKQSVRFVVRCFLIFILGSIAIAIAVPSIGTHTSGKFAGNWRGLMSFKNQMGWMAALFCVMWFGSRRHPRMTPKIFWPFFVLGLGLILMTSSATGLIVGLVGVVMFTCIDTYQRLKGFRLYLTFIGTMLLLAGYLVATEVITFIIVESGRDPSLTGRTTIWEEAWPFIEQNWWWGTGYSAFWANATDYFGYDNWVGGLNHAHNAYIEVLQDGGIIGLSAQLFFIAVIILRSAYYSLKGNHESKIILSVMACVLLIGISGALFFRPNTAAWGMVLIFSVFLWLVRTTRQTKKATHAT